MTVTPSELPARAEVAGILAGFAPELADLAARLADGDPSSGLALRDLSGRIGSALSPAGVPTHEGPGMGAADELFLVCRDRPDPILELMHSPLGREAWVSSSIATLDRRGLRAGFAAALAEAARRWAAHEIVEVRLPIPGRHYATD